SGDGKMKESAVKHYISFELLRFVRDTKPTEAELLSWLGEEEFRYPVLLSAGLLELEDGTVRISPKHLTLHGKGVWWDNAIFRIDDNTIDLVVFATVSWAISIYRPDWQKGKGDRTNQQIADAALAFIQPALKRVFERELREKQVPAIQEALYRRNFDTPFP